MKKGLSYDEEMTLLLELTDNMDDGDRECFTLEDAEQMVADQHTYERTHGLPEGEYDPHFWFDTIMDIIEQEAAEKAAAEELAKHIKTVVDAGTKLIKSGFNKQEMMDIVAKYNNGNGNPSGIQSVEIADAILSEFTEEINKTIAKKETK